ncbi:MAG: hypothetical protein MJ249_02155, partial [Kiritimatiellae bacterium]|nr:hypothetical protein [Kiritimatiellia bacterium]
SCESECPSGALKFIDTQVGVQDRTLWDAMWIGLANRAAIVKWFVTATEVGHFSVGSVYNACCGV